ncbi:MAG: hypothetical protein WCB94_08830 [Terriglobales bacterium]
MEDTAPHVMVSAFERLILFPVDLIVLLAGVAYLFQRQWLFGAFLLLMALLFGIVGQALPHRKRQSARQLYSQTLGERYGDLTREESSGLAKAVMSSSFLVGLVAGAAAVHRGSPWYWVLVDVVVAWVLFPALSVLFCFGWSGMMERRYGHRS